MHGALVCRNITDTSVKRIQDVISRCLPIISLLTARQNKRLLHPRVSHASLHQHEAVVQINSEAYKKANSGKKPFLLGECFDYLQLRRKYLKLYKGT